MRCSVLSLDFRKVVDRLWPRSLETFRTLEERPVVCVIILSKCADDTLPQGLDYRYSRVQGFYSINYPKGPKDPIIRYLDL